MLNDPYTPIDCAVYDSYEIAIMQNKRMQIRWTSDDGENHNEQLKPVKLQIKNNAEYLLLDSKINSEIRLDKILQAEIIQL